MSKPEKKEQQGINISRLANKIVKGEILTNDEAKRVRVSPMDSDNTVCTLFALRERYAVP